ncbi:MAG: TonB-dependent receptor, partial [Bacteroidales bacterium]|nr:TonB-dependent receptor [Bacteroidales bacterium]
FQYSHNWATDLRIAVDACAFYIDCTQQQLTVFPPGKNTGRMMTNAGKSRSFGAEISLSARIRQFYTDLDYGYTNARFVTFNDGHRDYTGKRIPYAPEHTLNGRLGVELPLGSGTARSLQLQLEGKAAGRIWWNEDNSLSQPFYAELGAYIGLILDGYTVYVRGDNLTNTSYGLFYFKSMGNEFFQTSLPLRVRLGISINL